MTENTDAFALELISQVVSAYVSHNSVPASGLPALIASVSATIEGLGRAAAQAPEPAPPVPAVPIKKSITGDYLISLEDGRKFRSLKRHLSVQYGMTPEQYRAKWNLPGDYPMVAPNYAAARSSLAKSTGLGRKAAAPEPVLATPAPRQKRARKAAAARA